MYNALLAVHVLAVIVWLGSGSAIQIMATRVRLTKDTARLAGILADASWFGTRVFIPSGILALLSGVGMVLDAWRFEDIWIAIGIAGWLISTVIGSAVLGPLSRKAAEQFASGSPDSQTTAGRLLAFMRIDLVILMLVAIDMVVKPGS